MKPRQSINKTRRFTSRIKRADVLEHIQVSEPGEGRGAREGCWGYVFQIENGNPAYLNLNEVYTITTGIIKIFYIGYT